MGATGTSGTREADSMQKINTGTWTLDEKMGQTYIWKDQANTLSARDYKQPQAVIYEIFGNDIKQTSSQDRG